MFTSASDVRQFALAGKAVLTIESAITNTHFTFKISRAIDKRTNEPSDLWFVGLLTGPDNETDYTYLGVLDGGTFGAPQFRMTRNSKVDINAPSVIAFGWAWNNIVNDKMPANLVVRHEGKCGRCMHTLTTPESVDTGFGPECSAVLGIEHVSNTPEPVVVEPTVEPIKASIDLKSMLENALRDYGTKNERIRLAVLADALELYFDNNVREQAKAPSIPERKAAMDAARDALDDPIPDLAPRKTITLPPPPPKKKPITTTEIETADDVPVF